jgi:hypothetical protein
MLKHVEAPALIQSDRGPKTLLGGKECSGAQGREEHRVYSAPDARAQLLELVRQAELESHQHHVAGHQFSGVLGLQEIALAEFYGRRHRFLIGGVQ